MNRLPNRLKLLGRAGLLALALLGPLGEAGAQTAAAPAAEPALAADLREEIERLADAVERTMPPAPLSRRHR